jgi:hypothetical protein
MRRIFDIASDSKLNKIVEYRRFMYDLVNLLTYLFQLKNEATFEEGIANTRPHAFDEADEAELFENRFPNFVG